MGQNGFVMARKLRTLGGDQRLSYLLKAVPLIDLTNLQPSATGDDIGRLCESAIANRTAAVCVALAHAPLARSLLPEGGPRLAIACGGFPSGRIPVSKKLEELNLAGQCGAEEIDSIINLDALCLGDTATVRKELSAMRKEAGALTLKIIIESGILSPAQISLASRLALDEGADFLKTSTGFAGKGANPAAIEIMIKEILANGRPAGIKPSGGIAGPDDALEYMLLAEGMLGPGCLAPGSFRLGASSLLEHLLHEAAVLSG